MLIKEIFGLHPYPEEQEVGIEIEVEGDLHFMDRLRFWRQDDDGSLRGNGMEYVLTEPVSREKVLKRLTYLKNKIKQNGLRLNPSERCGVHVHINCQYMEEQEVLNFMMLYLLFEEVLTRYCGEDREGNLFCLRASDAEYMLQCIQRHCKTGTISGLSYEDIRYAGLNLCALSKYGSLEFRTLRTPNNITRINVWVNILLRLKDQARQYKETYEIIEGISAQGMIRFAQKIFGLRHMERLLKGMSIEEFERIMKRQARRIQVVCYTPLKKEEVKAQPRPIRKHRRAEPVPNEFHAAHFKIIDDAAVVIDGNIRPNQLRRHNAAVMPPPVGDPLPDDLDPDMDMANDVIDEILAEMQGNHGDQ